MEQALSAAQLVQLYNDVPEAPEDFDVPTPTFLNAWWRNGNKELKEVGGVKHFGGWCINVEEVFETLPAEWTLQYFISKRNGIEYAAWATETLFIAVLQSRSFWVENREDEKPEYFREYAEGLTQKAELLGIVRGIASPVVAGAKVHNAKNLLAAYSQGYNTVNRAIRKARTQAEAVHRPSRNIAPYAVYLPLRGATKNGDAVSTMVGKKEQSPITPIVFSTLTMDDTWMVNPVIIAECQASLELARRWRDDQFTTQEQEQVFEDVDPMTGEIDTHSV